MSYHISKFKYMRPIIQDDRKINENITHKIQAR